MVRIDHARRQQAYADNNIVMPFEPGGSNDIGVGMPAAKIRVLTVLSRTKTPMQERKQLRERVSQTSGGPWSVSRARQCRREVLANGDFGRLQRNAPPRTG